TLRTTDIPVFHIPYPDTVLSRLTGNVVVVHRAGAVLDLFSALKESLLQVAKEKPGGIAHLSPLSKIGKEPVRPFPRKVARPGRKRSDLGFESGDIKVGFPFKSTLVNIDSLDRETPSLVFQRTNIYNGSADRRVTSGTHIPGQFALEDQVVGILDVIVGIKLNTADEKP